MIFPYGLPSGWTGPNGHDEALECQAGKASAVATTSHTIESVIPKLKLKANLQNPLSNCSGIARVT